MDNTSKRLLAENRGDALDAGTDPRLEVDMDMEVDVGGVAETADDASAEGAYLAHALRNVYYTP